VIAYQLRNNKYQTRETHFFDWLVTSIRTVNQLLLISHSQELRDKLNVLEFEEKLFEGHKVALCKSFDCMKTVHDLPPTINTFNIQQNFVDKYVRRYERFMNIVHHTEYVVFVLFINNIDNVFFIELNHLLSTLKSLRQNNPFRIAIVCKHKTVVHWENPRVSIYFLEDYSISSSKNSTWTLNQYDWKLMLSKIAS
tara:strand:- start:1293 stop:1880 length:588 start_codon:yes stop_codon:yes gene_type:complete